MTQIKSFSRKIFKKNRKIPVTVFEVRGKKFLEDEGFEVDSGKRLFGFYPDLRIVNTSLLIEIDGGYHNTKKQKRKDWRRTKILNSYGFTVIRFTNEQVLNKDLFISKIRAKLGEMERVRNSTKELKN